MVNRVVVPVAVVKDALIAEMLEAFTQLVAMDTDEVLLHDTVDVLICRDTNIFDPFTEPP